MKPNTIQPDEKITIVGGGMIGALEALYESEKTR